MTVTQQTTLDDSHGRAPSSANPARKQRLRLIVIAVVAACSLLTVVGGVINLLSQ